MVIVLARYFLGGCYISHYITIDRSSQEEVEVESVFLFTRVGGLRVRISINVYRVVFEDLETNTAPSCNYLGIGYSKILVASQDC